MRRSTAWLNNVLRLLACAIALITSVMGIGVPRARVAFAAQPHPQLRVAAPVDDMRTAPTLKQNAPRSIPNVRVVLADIPNDIIPQQSNLWQCSCDTDGCYPGCFTVAAASLAKYWAGRGYANLWNGDELGTLARLRDLFPNLFCYNNINNDGKPSDSGYDAYDVAKGFRVFIAERGYGFNLSPIPNATFEQVVAEIDAGRPMIGAFENSPWGSHAATIIGYDTTNGKQVMVVRPNLWNKQDTELQFGVGYAGFGIVTVAPSNSATLPNAETPPLQYQSAQTSTSNAPAFELVVDNDDAAFTYLGGWSLTQTVGYAGNARLLPTTDPSNFGPNDDTGWAKWTPEIPFDGVYDVQVYVPFTDTENIASRLATYRVNTAEGSKLVRRSQHDAVEGWLSLGSFSFVKGNGGSVYLGNKTGDDDIKSIYADAMRFVWRAPILVRPEENDVLFWVVNGKRHLIADGETLGALRLSRASVRALTTFELQQYPEAEPVPSIYTNWVGNYFNNANLAAPASLVRGDPSLNFRWSGDAPAPNMNGTNFSVRWTRMMALTEGEWNFNIEAVGGLRLFVDGKLLLDEWKSENVLVQHQASVKTQSGLHRIEVEYAAKNGYAQINFGNLAPNAPIILDAAQPNWTTQPSQTLRWADAGDVDNTDNARKFFVTVWHDEPTTQAGDVQAVWRTASNWITSTTWNVVLPEDGKYAWSVVASDGTANSPSSEPRTILLDRTSPWAQMQFAQTKAMTQTELPPQSYVLQNINGDLRGTEVLTNPTAPRPVLSKGIAPNYQPVFTPTGNLPAVKLTWWATDTLSGIASVDVQAKEVIRANTVYTFATIEQVLTRIEYAITISGSEEISVPVVVTETVPYTTVVPVLNKIEISPTEWVTVAVAVRGNSAVFIGTPGSTYEFRVRAHDGAGNTQDWYEGYSILAEIDPKTVLFRVAMPVLQK